MGRISIHQILHNYWWRYTESDLVSPLDESKENKVLRQRVAVNQSPVDKKNALHQYSNGSATTSSTPPVQDDLEGIIQRTLTTNSSKDINWVVIEALKEKIRQMVLNIAILLLIYAAKTVDNKLQMSNLFGSV